MSADRFARIVLGLNAAVFLFAGLLFLLRPETLGAIGIEGPGIDARNDLRAVYGGMELGIGVFLLLCMRGGEGRLHIGLILGGLVFGAMVAARVFSVAVDGSPTGFVWGLTLGEFLGGASCGVAFALLLRAESRGDAGAA